MSKNTTMLISKEALEKIKKFGKKGETYTDIINRMYNELKLKQNLDVLTSTKGYWTIKQAREWTKKKNRLDEL